MKYLSEKKGFLGLEAKKILNNKVIIIPFGLEKTVSYGPGTKRGPVEIIKASHQVELFDEELKKETYKKIGIKTLKPFKIKKKIISALNQISKIVENVLSTKKLPFVLGGEHSLTAGSIRPFAKKYKEIIILHLDAHADLRESYNGERYSHASAIKRCLDYKNIKVVSVGIRNLSQFEMNFYNKNKKRIKIFWAKDKKNWNLRKLENLFKNKNVYITFDVDCLDSSIMPATGTPEPGGLLWEEALLILKIVCKKANILGVDVNELAPIKGFNSYNFLAAKLVYKIIGYVFETKR